MRYPSYKTFLVVYELSIGYKLLFDFTNTTLFFFFFLLKQVMSKFNREGKGYVDFLDYVTYVPLFVEIHEKIIKDPLCSTVRIE